MLAITRLFELKAKTLRSAVEKNIALSKKHGGMKTKLGKKYSNRAMHAQSGILKKAMGASTWKIR